MSYYNVCARCGAILTPVSTATAARRYLSDQLRPADLCGQRAGVILSCKLSYPLPHQDYCGGTPLKKRRTKNEVLR